MYVRVHTHSLSITWLAFCDNCLPLNRNLMGLFMSDFSQLEGKLHPAGKQFTLKGPGKLCS